MCGHSAMNIIKMSNELFRCDQKAGTTPSIIAIMTSALLNSLETIQTKISINKINSISPKNYNKLLLLLFIMIINVTSDCEG